MVAKSPTLAKIFLEKFFRAWDNRPKTAPFLLRFPRLFVPLPTECNTFDDMTELRRERYINPYTDFGFKKLFGTEMNKDLLISFLNALFRDEQVIKDVKYLNSEKLGEGYGDRKDIFDVYSKTRTVRSLS